MGKNYNNKNNNDTDLLQGNNPPVEYTPPTDEPPADDTEKKVKVKIKSKTGKQYYRAGIRFNSFFEEHALSSEVVETLKKDSWLEVVEV